MSFSPLVHLSRRKREVHHSSLLRSCQTKFHVEFSLHGRGMSSTHRELFEKEYRRTGVLPRPSDMAKKFAEKVKEERKLESTTSNSFEDKRSFFSKFSDTLSFKSSFDLSAPPIPLTRKAQLAKLRMSVSSDTVLRRRIDTEHPPDDNSVKIDHQCVRLSEYSLSRHPMELRHQDIERFIEQENNKRMKRDELEKKKKEEEEERIKRKARENAKQSNSWIKVRIFILDELLDIN